jgi:hypothetical protein
MHGAWRCMMCVSITVTPESQEVRVSAADGEETIEYQPESYATHDEPENRDVSTGGYHSEFQVSRL